MKSVRIAAAVVLVAGGAGSAAQPAWRPARPVPAPRTEVAAAPLGREIAVVGGFLRSGRNTGRADAYSPTRNRWRRLPDLPVTVDHAMAAGAAGRLYVVGGYAPGSVARNTAFVFRRGRWAALPPMPAPRAAGGAAIVGGRLYVVGGVEAQGRLAREAFSFDLAAARWSTIRGPRPREHLGAAALDGRVYAVAGRTGGLDSNLDVVEAFDPRGARWRAVPPVPGKRGGTAAAAVAGRLVSAGGEEPGGTISTVYAYSPSTRRWTELEPMRTSRHGLGLVGWRGRAYALAGGPQPGLTVSAANEVLRLGS
ncbi:MAG TPA: kelch repeat-containing protein [Gaiellaceae bacterium]|nr:kelch repeat-containing protein [Gaiellaceae bacterium]